MGVQPSIFEREQSTVDERSRIATLAASLVSSGQMLMMDAGSTITQLAWKFARVAEALTIITNSYLVKPPLTPSLCTALSFQDDFNKHAGGIFRQQKPNFPSTFHP